jgi:hypothetical protein
MKALLFLILTFFFVSNVFGQNNTNTNNSGKAEEKILAPQIKELKKTNSVSAEEITVPNPAMDQGKALSTKSLEGFNKDQQSSMALQKAKFISKQSEFNQQRTQRTYSESQEDELNDLLRDLSAQSPASFESLLFYYENGQYDLNRSPALLKAAEMNPNDLELRKQMVIFYFLMQKTDELRKTLIDVFNAKIYPNAILNYGIDVLNSVPKNGILFTHGTEDSFGVLYAQRILKKREDVFIICLDWLNSPQLRTNLTANGYKLPLSNFIDINYLGKLCSLNQDKNIALALTIPKEYFIPIINKLYISGLVLQYKEIPTDNARNNEILWRTILEKKLIKTKDHDLVLNYLPMMAQLSRLYESDNQATQKVEMDKEISEVVRSRGKSLK